MLHQFYVHKVSKFFIVEVPTVGEPQAYGVGTLGAVYRREGGKWQHIANDPEGRLYVHLASDNTIIIKVMPQRGRRKRLIGADHTLAWAVTVLEDTADLPREVVTTERGQTCHALARRLTDLLRTRLGDEASAELLKLIP